jgi:RHS repeat-associated protein
LNRLSTAQEISDASSNPAWKQVYTYDRYGNRSLAAGSSLPSDLTKASTNPAIRTSDNRIDSNDSRQGNVRYDDAGNLTVDVEGRSFGYNAENHQVSYNGGDPNNGGANYSYDGNGRRVKKVNASDTTVFVYDVMGHLIAEYSTAAQTSAGGTSYLTEDALGTPRIVTGANKNILARHDYLPFGEELYFDGSRPGARSSAQMYVGDNIRQKFTGKERDSETGLDYFGARYMSAIHGRWSSPDVINLTRSRLNNPSNTLNKYVYAANNPLKFVDKDGEDITIFYRPPRSGFNMDFGHTFLGVLNQATGKVGFLDFYPAGNLNGTRGPGAYNSGDMQDRAAQVDRSEFATLTIQTTPEQAQKVLDLIEFLKTGRITAPTYAVFSNNCTTIVEDVLQDLGLDFGDILPETLFGDALQHTKPNTLFAGKAGRRIISTGFEYGKPRDVGMDYIRFLFQLYLHQYNEKEKKEKPPKGCVTTAKVGGGTETTCDQ